MEVVQTQQLLSTCTTDLALSPKGVPWIGTLAPHWVCT